MVCCSPAKGQSGRGLNPQDTAGPGIGSKPSLDFQPTSIKEGP